MTSRGAFAACVHGAEGSIVLVVSMTEGSVYHWLCPLHRGKCSLVVSLTQREVFTGCVPNTDRSVHWLCPFHRGKCSLIVSMTQGEVFTDCVYDTGGSVHWLCLWHRGKCSLIVSLTQREVFTDCVYDTEGSVHWLCIWHRGKCSLIVSLTQREVFTDCVYDAGGSVHWLWLWHRDKCWLNVSLTKGEVFTVCVHYRRTPAAVPGQLVRRLDHRSRLMLCICWSCQQCPHGLRYMLVSIRHFLGLHFVLLFNSQYLVSLFVDCYRCNIRHVLNLCVMHVLSVNYCLLLLTVCSL